MTPFLQSKIEKARQMGMPEDLIQKFASQDSPSESPSVGGFAKNLGQDVGDIAQGLVNLPGTVIESAKQGKLGELGGKTLEGLVNEYKQLVINPRTNKFDITRPFQAAYERPVSTLLDVLPLAQIGKAGLIAKAGKAGKVGKLAEETSVLGKTGEVIQTATGKKVVSTAIKTAGSAGEDFAARTFASAFKIPQRFVERIKPIDTAREILTYGFKPTSLTNMQGIVNRVTGAEGTLSKVVRNAAGIVKNPVKMDTVYSSLKNLIDETSLASDKAVELSNEVGRIINSGGGTIGEMARPSIPVKVPSYPINRPQAGKIVPGQAQFVGPKPGELKAIDALDIIRKLEQKGYAAAEAAKRNVLDPIPLQDRAKVFLGIADELMDQFEKVVGDSKIIDQLKTPGTYDELKSISPKLAQQFLEAKTVREVRSIQAPFVRLGKMIKLNDVVSQSVVPGLSRDIGGRLIGTVAGLNLAGLPGMVAGIILGPSIEQAVESVRFPLMFAVSQGTKISVNKAAGVAFSLRKAFEETTSKIGSMTETAGGLLDQAKIPLTTQPLLRGATASGEGLPLRLPAPSFPSTVGAQEQEQSSNGFVSPGGQWKWDAVQKDWVPNETGQPGKIGLTREKAYALAALDMATNGGKNLTKIATLYKTFGSDAQSKMSAQSVQKLIGVNTAKQIVKEYAKIVEGLGLGNDPMSRLGGKIKVFLGQNTEWFSNVASYDRTRKGSVAMLAKALGNIGTLSDKDIAIFSEFLPKVDDTHNLATENLSTLNKFLQFSENAITQSGQQEYLPEYNLPSNPAEVQF